MQARIAIGGFMGSGKSTVGQALAQKLDVPFVDMDEVLAAEHGPIDEQFARDGESAFRKRETALLERLAGEDGPMVVATGGGAWCSDANQALLEEHFSRVVLLVSLPACRERVGQGAGRPVWHKAEELFAYRKPWYDRADLRVSTDGCSIDEVVEEIATWQS